MFYRVCNKRYITSCISKMSTLPTFETLTLSQPSNFVVHVELNRPDKRNSMNKSMWCDIGSCFAQLGNEPFCRAIILSGLGKMFCAGIDLSEMMRIGQAAMSTEKDAARKSFEIRRIISEFQSYLSAIEKCPKPVIACVHDGCIGGGVNVVAAVDIRYATKSAYFQVKEVAVGLAADVGVLQRLPKMVANDSAFRELAFTARSFNADEALNYGLISRIFDSKEEMIQHAIEISKHIANQSPVAVQGTKVNLNFSRDHSVQEGLDYMALWNSVMLQSEDVVAAATAMATKSNEKPIFAKL